MATVVNKAENALIDPSFCNPTRKNAGDPSGSLTPAFAGEIVLDTTTGNLYKAVDLTTTGWAVINPPK